MPVYLHLPESAAIKRVCEKTDAGQVEISGALTRTFYKGDLIREGSGKTTLMSTCSTAVRVESVGWGRIGLVLLTISKAAIRETQASRLIG